MFSFNRVGICHGKIGEFVLTFILSWVVESVVNNQQNVVVFWSVNPVPAKESKTTSVEVTDHSNLFLNMLLKISSNIPCTPCLCIIERTYSNDFD